MNPSCPHKDLTGKVCGKTLYRQKSGRRKFWKCLSNHKYKVGSELSHQ